MRRFYRLSGPALHAACALVAVLFVAAGSPATAQDLRIVAQDAGGMTVEYRPQVTQRTVTIDGRAYTDVRVTGGGWDASSLPGEPAIPMRAATLVLPSLVGNTVVVLEADYGDAPGVLVAPMPWEAVFDGGASDDAAMPLGAGYARGGWVPAATATLENVGVARDVVLGTLRFSPVQWDAATRVLRTYTRIVLRIEFGVRVAGLVPRARGGELPEAGILNAQMARQWTLARAGAAPMRRSATTASLASGDWFRFEVTEEGMYRLPKSWFTSAGISLEGVDPRTIKIYNSGGRELPTSRTGMRPDALHEIAIEVVGESDGRFDDGDAVVLYARGVSGFRYDAARKRHQHVLHRYASSISYLLTFGGMQGRRIEALPSRSDVEVRPQWFMGREFAEEEVTNILQSGKMWLSRKITPGLPGAGITYTRRLEGIVSSQPVLYRMELWSQADNGTSNFFRVSESGTELGMIQMPTVNLATDRSDIAASSGLREFTGTGALADGRSVLALTYSASEPTRNRGGYVNWVEWHYARAFNATGDVLAFNGVDTTAVIGYELNGFTNSDIRIYDVTRFDSVRVVTGADVSGGTVRFGAQAVAGTPGEFIALTAGAFRTPGAPARVQNTSAFETTGAEAIIITHQDFTEAAGRLAQHRMRAEDPISTLVVTVPEIYTGFNAGTPDPTAIRDFIAHAFATWQTPPRYVLMLGDGNYDYKGNDAGVREPQYVPVWESENSVNLIDCYVSDDYYVQVAGNDSRVDLAIGRLPAQSAAEAMTMVDKIIRYENDPTYDGWRNRLTFVADDGWTTRDDFERNQHTSQSEGIAESMDKQYEKKKIYIVSYRTDVTAQGRRKPDAAQAIVDQINEGTVVINWTGHGSESVWAHEQVFSNESTIPKLRNADRLSFFVAATCTFGLYDRPGLRSGMEELMLRDDRGAIGGLTAPRVVFSHENSLFNATFLENVINRGREADGRVRRIGDGLWSSKQTWTGSVGYEKFYLMGDPAMRLGLPRHRAAIDSIYINDVLATGDTVQMRALSRVTIAASVRQPDGALWTGFTGVSDVTLFDAERRVRVEEWDNWEYNAPGGVLYRGQASVRDGRFRVSFIVPKDISYENRSGRFAVYFDNSATDGAGYSTAFRVGGSESDTTADNDREGPVIELFLDSRSFRAGDVTNENAVLIADLADASGINTTGLGIGHAIELWIDGAEPSIVLNDYYTGEVDSWQRGTVTYPLRGLTPGTHTLRLRAWDVLNNSSTAETYFTVSSSSGLTVHNVHAWPNPMQQSTTFTFQHNQSSAVDVDVKIYTLSGRHVKTLEARGVTERFVQMAWSGLDGDGDRLGNGVYFYKVVCRTADGRFASEAIGKLSVLR